MKQDYVVTEDYLKSKGLILSDYVLDDIFIPAIINIGLDLLVTRICYLDDNKSSEKDIETALDEDATRVDPFLKAQYRIIYNLIFMGETSPTDAFVDNIIAHELGWGKINGWQKGIYYRHNR